MKKSDDLFRLIKSLTKAEKRYFKMYSSLQKGEKKYILLFEAIEKQQNYDEDELKVRFQSERFVRQFNVVKNYLYNLLMKSLRISHMNTGVRVQVDELFHNAEILERKGLYDQSAKMIAKARQLANEYELFGAMIEAEELEISLYPERLDSIEGIYQTYSGLQQAIEQTQNIAEYSILQAQVRLAIRNDYARNDSEKKLLQSSINHPLMAEEKRAQSFKALIRYHTTYATYYYALKDDNSAFEHQQKLVELYEQNSQHMHQQPDKYIRALANLMTLYRRLGKDDLFWRTLEKQRTIANEMLANDELRSVRLLVDIFVATYLSQLSIYLGRGEYDKCQILAAEIEEHLQRYSPYLPSYITHKFYHSIAYMHYCQANFRQALVYVNRILQGDEPEEGKYTYYATYLLGLIIHYDLGNTELLEYRVRSTYRYLRSRSSAHQFEQVILNFFRSLSRRWSSEQTSAAFIELRSKLEELRSDPAEQHSFRYFGYIPWLNSKINGTSYAEELRKELLEETVA